MIFMAHGIDNATLTLLAGTAHASYPLDNLKSRIWNKQFRTANGSATTIRILIDFGATRTCDTIVVGNTNYDVEEGGILKIGSTDNGAYYVTDTIAFADNNPDEITDSASQLVAEGFSNSQEVVVEGSTSNDGTYTVNTVAVGSLTLDVTESLTAEIAGDTVTLHSFDTDIRDAYSFSTGNEWSYYATFTESTKRYWVLELTGFAANAGDYIGQIFLGKRYTTPFNSDYNFGLGYSYGVQSNMTRGGVDLRYKTSNAKYVEQNLKFRGFTDAQVITFLTYFNNSEKTDGTLKPFFFLPDGETIDACYGVFENESLIFNKVVKDFNEITLNIRQQL